MVERTGGPDRGKICGIEAEEIYAGLASMRDIGADVELGKSRQSRQRRQSAGTNATHVEGNDSNPALAIESIECQL